MGICGWNEEVEQGQQQQQQQSGFGKRKSSTVKRLSRWDPKERVDGNGWKTERQQAAAPALRFFVFDNLKHRCCARRFTREGNARRSL
ncbi:hypothetical protein LTR56_002503 [Elasticomyces elasticus]|nr:hypothetical protein LTR22_020202 [Elasticomyces elasticus]KAK3657361.1 hypothetical protein LTR56_002503 [Elasticomyces elasticus]KAK4933555.1 hypothetical protein LTR49_000017 [Elasticomyces elasticus]KAK5754803.1 hypothetical protein LTS12_015120 [Elasticomyces elasticus]